MKKHIVSFSGGKDSTAMLLMMIEKQMQIDEIVCCDTGMEFPAMYRHWEKVEKHIDRKITILKPDKSFEYYLAEHVKTKGKNKGKKGYGWPWLRTRWCTKALKIKVINDYFKNSGEYSSYIGIASDESERQFKSDGLKCETKKHPLIEWGITEKEALQYCYDLGFFLGRFVRVF